MSITIDHPEVEALIADLAATTHRAAPDLLLDLLRRERERVSGDREMLIARGRAIDEDLRRRWNADAAIDPREPDAFLVYDDNGLPA